ncbi:flagellar attachment zone protein 1-like isoform X1 [Vespa mandarinia]|uniref:flagellar attachment zone protein 1-like isoform X1 n=1 Tax=Vespa mandarinia TaxID=7446 RepID=UPI00160CE112|nr:flagellar attachment zone protein 1-like isoform X1 [Vespa mandarinia]
MEGVDGQLQTKYQKMATEYSKICAQANVLKKAVIDEQTRNGEIREQLKEKEIELRRAEQEIDSLTFRNQQLTKRITVLQEELDKEQNKSRKGKGKISDNNTQVATSSKHILDEEVQKKAIENAKWMIEIMERNYEIEGLRETLYELEYKLDLVEKSKVELCCQHRREIDKLETEKNDLQRKLHEKQRQEETISCSSTEGKREGHECEQRGAGVSNQIDNTSPVSSPSPSRRSSKSFNDGKIPKLTDERSYYEPSKSYDIEKELHHWKTQYHIVKIKCDEYERKEQETNKAVARESLNPVEINNMIGKLHAPFALPKEIEAREAKIREYFLDEINKLIMEKHICHVKNLAMAANDEVMHAHLDTCESKREKCELALSEALSNCNTLQKDKETQEGNYKAQLSTMSEHLANMNDKLICQTEEIQQLKFELANKNNRKGKQK